MAAEAQGVATAPGGIRLSCDFYYTYVCPASSLLEPAGRGEASWPADFAAVRSIGELGGWLLAPFGKRPQLSLRLPRRTSIFGSAFIKVLDESSDTPEVLVGWFRGGSVRNCLRDFDGFFDSESVDSGKLLSV